jgi:hypothetical protein
MESQSPVRGVETLKTIKPQSQSRSRADRAVAAKLFALLKSGGDARVSKVRRVKQSVRRKSYENELKLSIAVDRLARTEFAR